MKITQVEASSEKTTAWLKENVHVPAADSHKGQNGKVLLIGGSHLFHAPVLWAVETASRLVDMVHVTSISEEVQELMKFKLQEKFWNGIVLNWNEVENYVVEDDVVVIGPGMERGEEKGEMKVSRGIEHDDLEGLSQGEKTSQVVNYLLSRYPTKRWVIDGGALQEVDESLLGKEMIITPHHREWERLSGKEATAEAVLDFSKQHQGLVILLKGSVDLLTDGTQVVEISGGHSGMTKGGTGDVLAGLVAGLAATNDLWVAAYMASVVNKRAGERLASRVGPFFNATDLMNEIPHVLQEIVS